MEHKNQYKILRHEASSILLHQLKPTQLNALKNLKDQLRSSGISDLDTIWGIPLLGGGGEDSRADVVLLKFLSAERFKVLNTLQLLHKCLAWRKEYKADTILEEKEIFNQYQLGDLDLLLGDFAYIQGYDREQRPVCYVAFAGIKDNIKCGSVFGSKQYDRDYVVEKFVRWSVQLLERTIRQHLDFKPCGGVDYITEVHDLKDIPFHMYLLLEGCHKFSTLAAEYYPWITSRKIYINLPWYTGLLAYPFMMKSHKNNGCTLSKKGKTTETLFRFIPPHHVPVQYGGLSRRSDEQNGPVKPAKEAIVRGSETLEIEIDNIPGGVTTNWEIIVEGWEVKYSVKFIPSARSGFRQFIILQEPMRFTSSWRKVIRETFTWPEPGRLLLRVDNIDSSNKKKIVAYRHSFLNAKQVPAAEHSFLTD